jgi:hypothetical protein
LAVFVTAFLGSKLNATGGVSQRDEDVCQALLERESGIRLGRCILQKSVDGVARGGIAKSPTFSISCG